MHVLDGIFFLRVFALSSGSSLRADVFYSSDNKSIRDRLVNKVTPTFSVSAYLSDLPNLAQPLW